ncbi:MAG: bifunctional diaminohydroxyphosphoribosylaminopyrimidine deaminase/5-amino-6-(5-phosphoribosylamino)uracil reductase RibD [Oleispira antarctica]|uniref:Riboflavin biosynthesis protein RibD n=1 Tax=Oleispira antarctica RB-8 TaxID=698738 RepID=R4YU73_OLEAN|nr:bifunctional diaminohydroxyphosphoribosylaminopyrimidine deaminase/5-amino-6-(5-phosphoribosylamino)uracil reductase RibD [Oleispira antarctica]MBQ0792971.1 bifunctional diaminohydroxyphosphoribosylaminopyrimidine deaminase/5-amino-6-(5-phosphoribosylamino)uracil reductase RibD [Oleispira antarctica]CCK77628.1 Riboflavin biosynthesis protein [Oleispira antarctica RB-8]|tara:strand:- start:2217 stop:3353 length:1137 start_codon:yes stop_codon:yes gene_type:complete
MASDQEYMALAIQLAKRGLYTTSPNPRVGCVLVKNDEIIGQGFHIKAGEGHAEVNAIADAKLRGNDTQDATAYVTLEPCSHFGRTPPCSQGLIDAQVARVVGAMTDPNPQVAGNGFNRLRAAGIEVVDNCLAAESAKLNPGFIKRMSMAADTALPYVRLKMATSLDGRTAMQSGESQWITGPEARADVQRLRAQSCAIICGADSVLIDDPSMNVRIQTEAADGAFQETRQPLRVIIDSQHRVTANAKIFTHPGKVMIVSPVAPESTIHSDVCSVSYLQTATNENSDRQQVDLKGLLVTLARQGINEILVESGAKLAGAFIEHDLVDELVLFTAPTLLGSDARPAFNLPFAKMEQQIRWSWHDVRMVGNDLKLILKRKF